ncbi:hypothetical protein [Streptomyces iranensis]
MGDATSAPRGPGGRSLPPPRRVEFIDAFPLGPSGKVLKRELVGRFTTGR